MSTSTHAKEVFDGPGYVIVKKVFDEKTMDDYNAWCAARLDDGKEENSTHPKQADKFLINNVLERMSRSDPHLLWKLVGNKTFWDVADSLLGFATVGAFTTHWIRPGGRAQTLHVDYPLTPRQRPILARKADTGLRHTVPNRPCASVLFRASAHRERRHGLGKREHPRLSRVAEAGERGLFGARRGVPREVRKEGRQREARER